MKKSAQPALGYACKLIGVPDAAITSTVLRCATPETLRRIINHNLDALARIVEYNAAAGIKLFRISSDIIPFGSHPAGLATWRTEFARRLRQIGDRMRETGLRVSMHPGQYTVLNSPDAGVAENAILDLCYHADVLNSLGMARDSKIILHVGGVYGDKEAALARFSSRFAALDASVRQRLILENDEKCYSIAEVTALAETLAAPVVMDVFHHQLNPPKLGSLDYWLKRAAATWSKADGKAKIHYSQQLSGGKPGMHSRTIVIAGDAAERCAAGSIGFLDLYRKAARFGLDIMLEVKDKNLSAEKCLLCASALATSKQPPRSALTDTWARYKYAVLEHSQKRYQAIRSLLKQASPDPIAMFAEIDAALAEPATPGSACNAGDHIWGYFKQQASEKEQGRYRAYRDAVLAGKPAAAMKKFLHSLAEKYDQPYLLNSLYFYLDNL
ncbi:MAG: UV DNA damage repair endonuclease UvsE [Planctomycetes bacterium]|nr:UV DNA damage repair endonuclease UvsE [Planctomycetota bacterium]